MASKNIKGITIEIGGDSTDLQKALQKPERDIRNLVSELRQIDSNLKFNPDSMELLAQKSTVLGQEIAAVSEKLKILKDSQAEVAAQAERGDIGAEQYRAFQREIVETTSKLSHYKELLKENGQQIKEVGERTGEASKNSDQFKRAVEEQRRAVEKAKTSSEEHGKSVRKLKDDYQEAESGALSFSEAVKATAVGHLLADGIKSAASALWDFAATGAESARELEVNERKLELVLRNTVNASDAYIDSIKELIDQEERLGVVSGHTQTAAAQELATYVTKRGTLEDLIPVLNDMIAQQYGVNASQEAGVTVATALGKTLDGQVGSLQRWGYRFSEAEQEILKTGNELQKVNVITRAVTDSVGGLSHGLRESTAEGERFGIMLEIEPIQREFGQNVENIKTQLLKNLIPALADTTASMNEFVLNNGESFERFGEIIGSVANAVATLLRVIASIPAPVLRMVAGILLAVKAFASVESGLKAFNGVLGIFGATLSPTTIKILALISAVSVLLFLIVALKEGTNKASKAMNDLGNVASSATNAAQSGAPRGYASGTNNAARGWALVGEDGPELVRFSGGEQVYTAAQSRSMASSNSGINPIGGYVDNRAYNITVNGLKDFQDFLDMQNMVRIRTRAAGGI